MNIQKIDISNLEISPLNVRKYTKDEDDQFSYLKNNIESNGLLNPLTVKLNNDTNKYEIIAGQRRYYALKDLNYNLIDCNIISNDKNHNDQVILSLTENIHRSNMLLSERVKAIQTIINSVSESDEFKFNNDKYEEKNKKIYTKVANLINVKYRTIQQYCKISHFPDFLIDKLDAKGCEKISLEFAISLSKSEQFTKKIMEYTNSSDDESKKKIEEALIEIIDIFQDIRSSQRMELIKIIIVAEKQNKYDNFYKFMKSVLDMKAKFIEDHQPPKPEPPKPEPSNLDSPKSESPNLDLPNPESPNPESPNTEPPLYINVQIRNPQLQNKYREDIIKRFNRCIVSDMDVEVCEAAHIIPFSDCYNFDIDNGLLLNKILHTLFDNHRWSIHPDTLRIEISSKCNDDIYNIIKLYENKDITVLKPYPNIIKYLTHHYNVFLDKK